MIVDSLIVGGGAAGLFLAGALGGAQRSVLVLERRERPARKLLITGKGRCNLTNLCEPEEFLNNVVRGRRFLYSASHRFTAADTMEAFERMGVPLKVERGRRVFPKSERAMDIVDALVRDCGRKRVTIREARVTGIELSNGVYTVKAENGGEWQAKNVVIATGGLSYPATGSSGDGYTLAKSLGHSVTDTYPSLVGIKTVERDIAEAQGLSLKNISLSLWDVKKPKKPVYNELGEALITHYGISGPLALTASALLDPYRAKDYYITLDLKPGLSLEELDKRLCRDFLEYRNRDFLNSLDKLLPHSLIPVVVSRSGVMAEKKVNSVTRGERQALAGQIKGLRLNVKALEGYDEAVITRGGIALNEIDPKTMGSKRSPGLYFAGEVLDCDALTGGYNLQIAFSTAFLAAEGIKGSF